MATEGVAHFHCLLNPLMKTPPDSTKGLPMVCKMLMVEERKERSAKGLYFNYDDHCVPGHKCKGRLFPLDVDQSCLVELLN